MIYIKKELERELLTLQAKTEILNLTNDEHLILLDSIKNSSLILMKFDAISRIGTPREKLEFKAIAIKAIEKIKEINSIL